MANTMIACSLGQFLTSSAVSQVCMLASSLHPVSDYDERVIRKVLEENWETEEQMVSNLLMCPYLIPDDIRIDYLLKGLRIPAHPYYCIASAIGSQSVLTKSSENGKTEDELIQALRQSTCSEHGLVAIRGFMALQPHLSYPNDVDFVTDILKKHNSSLFRNSLLWLLLNVEDRTEIKRIVQSDKLTAKGKTKSLKIIEDYFNEIDSGKQLETSLETLDFIPNFEDFDAMLDKEETLSEFFVDIDTNRDGKVSFDEILSFLEDIGKKIDAQELRQEIELLESGCNGQIEKDVFLELMFPKFQIV